MPDGEVPAEGVERGLVENLRHQAHVLVDDDAVTVADRDPGRLLASVLQRVQPVISELGDVLTRRPDTEDTAGVAWRPVGGIEFIRQAAVGLWHMTSLMSR